MVGWTLDITTLEDEECAVFLKSKTPKAFKPCLTLFVSLYPII